MILMIYNNIFHEKQHFVTVRDRRNDKGHRRMIHNQKQLDRILDNQKPYQDVFITKYPSNRIIECIILDFDSESMSKAYKDAWLCWKTVTDKELNAVIITSTNKGFHVYIQTPPHLFKDSGFKGHFDKMFDWNFFFKQYIYNLIDYSEDKYPCLDDVNTSAGFGGNIRVIGSIHPSTKDTVRIFKGDFIDTPIPTDKEHEAFVQAYDLAKCKLNKDKLKHEMNIINKGVGRKVLSDPVQDNDLRDLMPEIFGESIKIYPRGYGYMCCPFHSDSRPSLLVTKEWFSCSSCGAKGNWWTLRKEGYVDFPKNE